MSERPILFSSAMVLANRQNRKTETRRLARKPNGSPAPIMRLKVGDILWVREGYHVGKGYDDLPARDLPLAHSTAIKIWYAADGLPPDWAGKYRAGMFMPRAASRDSLRVLAVRVEPLQEITEVGCIHEGASGLFWAGTQRMCIPDPEKAHISSTPRAWYRELFDKINGPGSWDKNPDVVVISYERLTK